MRRLLTRPVAALVALALAVASCGNDDTTASDADPDGSVESVCAAYRDAAPAFFILAFASMADDPDVTVTSDGPGSPDDIYVLLSPAVAPLWDELSAYAAAEGLAEDAAMASQLAELFADGVQLLRDAGLDEAQLDILRDVANWPDDDGYDAVLPESLTEGIADGEAIFEGSADLAARIDEMQHAAEADESTLDDEESDELDLDRICAEIDQAAVGDPCELLSDATVASVLGDDTPTRESDAEPILSAVNCLWEAGDAAVSVSIYPASEYETSVANFGPDESEFSEHIEDVGDRAFLATGFSTLTTGRGTFGARTVYVLDGDAALVIGYDSGASVSLVDQAEIDDATDAADTVVLRLAEEVLGARG